MTTSLDDSQLLEAASQHCQKLQAQLAKVVLGQEQIVEALLTSLLAEGHVLLVGVPGLAKTLLVKTLAEALGLSFSRIQFTPDMMPSDITGTEVLEGLVERMDTLRGGGSGSGGSGSGGGGGGLRFVGGPVFAHLVLADEINRTPPKTQAALLEAMQEKQVTTLGQTHRLPDPFVVVATQNPIEQDGTYPLPEAQLDRFLFSLWLTYPSHVDETKVVMATVGEPLPKIEQVVDLQQWQQMQKLVKRVPVGEPVADYAVRLCRATRPQEGAMHGSMLGQSVDAGEFGQPEVGLGDGDRERRGGGGGGLKKRLKRQKQTQIQSQSSLGQSALQAQLSRYVQWGAGTRAAQAMVLGGKALAVMHGEPTVSLEHVQSVAPHVLRHRLVLNYQAAADGVTVDDVIEQLLDQVPMV